MSEWGKWSASQPQCSFPPPLKRCLLKLTKSFNLFRILSPLKIACIYSNSKAVLNQTEVGECELCCSQPAPPTALRLLSCSKMRYFATFLTKSDFMGLTATLNTREYGSNWMNDWIGELWEDEWISLRHFFSCVVPARNHPRRWGAGLRVRIAQVFLRSSRQALKSALSLKGLSF